MHTYRCRNFDTKFNWSRQHSSQHDSLPNSPNAYTDFRLVKHRTLNVIQMLEKRSFPSVTIIQSLYNSIPILSKLISICTYRNTSGNEQIHKLLVHIVKLLRQFNCRNITDYFYIILIIRHHQDTRFLSFDWLMCHVHICNHQPSRTFTLTVLLIVQFSLYQLQFENS